MRKTTVRIDFQFSKKKNHSFIADTKLHVDQITRKLEAKLNMTFFF